MIIYYFREHVLHDLYPHPENASRIESIRDELRRYLDFVEVEPDFDEDVITSVHSPRYVRLIKSVCSKIRSYGFLDPDTYVVRGTYRAAVLAANLLIRAYEVKNKHIFALTRPPGHHAERDEAGGFCIFNNVAILARRAVNDELSVLILDFDYHHGNGTQSLLPENAVFISIHRYGVYPGTGHYYERDRGNVYNIPLMFTKVNDAEYFYVFRKIVLPVIQDKNPDLIIVSMGFDCQKGDLIGDWHLESVWRNIFKDLRSYRIIFALEGGYNPQGILRGILEIERGLRGNDISLGGKIRDEFRLYIESLVKHFNLSKS